MTAGDVILTVGLAGLLGASVGLLASWLGRPGEAPAATAPPLPDELEPPRQVVVVRREHGYPGPAAAAELDVGALYGAAKNVLQPLAQEAAQRGLEIAGDAVRNGSINLATVSQPTQVADPGVLDRAGDAITSPSRAAVGDLLTTTGQAVGQLSGMVGQAAYGVAGIRGASRSEQIDLFGKTALETVKTGISAAVPLVGAAVAQVVGLAAGTYEGQRVVTEIGREIEDVYAFQKNVVNGDLGAIGGGSSQADRSSRNDARFWQLVADVTGPQGHTVTQAEYDLAVYYAANPNWGRLVLGGRLQGTSVAEWVKGLAPGTVYPPPAPPAPQPPGPTEDLGALPRARWLLHVVVPWLEKQSIPGEFDYVTYPSGSRSFANGGIYDELRRAVPLALSYARATQNPPYSALSDRTVEHVQNALDVVTRAAAGRWIAVTSPPPTTWTDVAAAQVTSPDTTPQFAASINPNW